MVQFLEGEAIDNFIWINEEDSISYIEDRYKSDHNIPPEAAWASSHHWTADWDWLNAWSWPSWEITQGLVLTYFYEYLSTVLTFYYFCRVHSWPQTAATIFVSYFCPVIWSRHLFALFFWASSSSLWVLCKTSLSSGAGKSTFLARSPNNSGFLFFTNPNNHFYVLIEVGQGNHFPGTMLILLNFLQTILLYFWTLVYLASHPSFSSICSCLSTLSHCHRFIFVAGRDY